MQNSLLHFLNEITPLSLEEELLIRESFRPRFLPKGEYLLKAGDVAGHIAFLNKGLIRYFVFKNGEESTFEFTREGEFVGDYQSFSQRKPSVQNLHAIEDCELQVISYEDVQKIFSNTRNGNLIGRLILEHRFDVMVGQLLSVYMHSQEERYHQFVSSYSDLAQRIPQYLIASYVGVKPQSLSRIRSRIKRIS